MGGTIDWAVDLIKFHEPPNSGVGTDNNPGRQWAVFKERIASGQDPNLSTCDAARLIRSGDWVGKPCTVEAVAEPSKFTPSERWELLDCQNGWKDAVRVWLACHAKGKELLFSNSIAEFLHSPGIAACEDMSANNNCEDSVPCAEHNSPFDDKKYHTGACTYEIWNSLTALHSMIKNYDGSLAAAGIELRSSHEEFINTFAPKPDDGTALLTLLLTLIPIPLNTGAARFFGGSFMTTKFFSGDSGGGKSSMWEAATSNIVNAGASIAKDALNAASSAREEIAFEDIYSTLIGNWKSQTDMLNKKLFEGDPASIDSLTAIISDGKMINGKWTSPSSRPENTNYTIRWNREKNIQRAFYAAAIPAAWTANRPAPVVVDFGPSCKIDARKYFTEQPAKYNSGWRCINAHSYILAGVRDGPQGQCGPATPGSSCNPTGQWTLDILKGIGEIQDDDNDWGGVTVDDLIIGAVTTWEKNGKKNIMGPPTSPIASDKSVADEYNGGNLDIRRANLIKIPVCSAEEAKANLNKGRKSYGTSPNYPCNP